MWHKNKIILLASVWWLNRARPLILIYMCVLVSQLGVFICLQIGRLGMRGIKRVKERDWKSERGKGRERVGRREGSGWNPDVSQLPEWERERGGERQGAPIPFAAGVDPPLHIQHTHTNTRTPCSQTHLFGKLFFLFSPPLSAPSLPTYVCTHS